MHSEWHTGPVHVCARHWCKVGTQNLSTCCARHWCKVGTQNLSTCVQGTGVKWAHRTCPVCARHWCKVGTQNLSTCVRVDASVCTHLETAWRPDQRALVASVHTLSGAVRTPRS